MVSGKNDTTTNEENVLDNDNNNAPSSTLVNTITQSNGKDLHESGPELLNKNVNKKECLKYKININNSFERLTSKNIFILKV